MVPFRARGLRASGETQHRPQPPTSPIESLAKYEGGEEREDTYRHRMMVNLAALAFTVVLALAGVWLAMQIADIEARPAWSAVDGLRYVGENWQVKIEATSNIILPFTTASFHCGTTPFCRPLGGGPCAC